MSRLILLFLFFIPFQLFSQDAKEIVRKADEKTRGKSTRSVMMIQSVRPKWTREMQVKTWGKGTDYALILVLSPAKDKGVTFLKRKKEVWNWLPTLERNIKLPPSMMSQSWMGTDFTNEDLVKESSVVEDYSHRLLGSEVVDDRDCYRIEMIPKPDAPVVWGKVLVWIDKKDYLQLKSEFYDEDGALVNTILGSDIKLMDKHLIPTRLEMIPAGKKGQKTVITYQSIQFDMPIEDSFFSTQNMTKVQ